MLEGLRHVQGAGRDRGLDSGRGACTRDRYLGATDTQEGTRVHRAGQLEGGSEGPHLRTGA